MRVALVQRASLWCLPCFRERLRVEDRYELSRTWRTDVLRHVMWARSGGCAVSVQARDGQGLEAGQ